MSAETGLRGIDAVVLAGGLGTRIRGILGETPKVLAPVRDRTFLDFLLCRLAALRVGRVILCLGYQADKVRDHLSAHPSPVPVECVVESEPLGTGGAIRLARPLLRSQPVLIMNGDTWLEADYAAFLAHHDQAGRDLDLLCVKVPDISRFGSVTLSADAAIDHFLEKDPSRQGEGLISGGVYLFGQSALDRLMQEPGPSLETDFFARERPGSLGGWVAKDARFLDIGTPETLALADSIIQMQV